MKKMPPTLDKAMKDKPFSYALALRDGSIVEFEGAVSLGDTGWVKLEGVAARSGPLCDHEFILEYGLEVALDDIVWVIDAPHGS